MVSEKERLEAQNKIPNLRPLSSFTDKEKCEAFDKLWQHALHLLNRKAKNGRPPKDSYYHCFEQVMDLLGEDVWDIYNKLGK